MKKNKLTILFFIAVLLITLGLYLKKMVSHKTKYSPLLVSSKTWKGFKNNFITSEGQVVRPKYNDTVSEGQAYSMLRAVGMNDKSTFDKIFNWTEKNLSRKDSQGDHLLSWHFQNGKIKDSMPASDADLDYALSLCLAALKWGKEDYKNCEYFKKAEKILKDILALETFRLNDGRIFLAPWILKRKEPYSEYPLNPSYFSPAHFRTFYLITNNYIWLELVKNSYWLLNELNKGFNNIKGKGLIPDWCEIDLEGKIGILEGKNPNFGWEAVRIPFRVILDFLWYKENKAKNFLNDSFGKFAVCELKEKNKLYSEYLYTGKTENPYENPLFYSAFTISLLNLDKNLFNFCLKTCRSFIISSNENGWVYLNEKEYFVNALSWIPESILNNEISTNPFKLRKEKDA